MRFTLRPGADPIAEADPIMLRAIGLPSGGVVAVGSTHVLVRPGVVAASELRIGPEALGNSGATLGQSVDVTRVLPPAADRVVAEDLPLTPHAMVTALHGRVVTTGDAVSVSGPGGDRAVVRIVAVDPSPAGTVGPSTSFTAAPAHSDAGDDPTEDGPTRGGEDPTPTDRTTAALLSGLDTQIEVLTGWFSLLASARELERAWALPRVAGVLLEGPVGCGKGELVAEAARRAGAVVREVDSSAVFKADRLLDRLSGALDAVSGPSVIFVDRIEAVIGAGSLTTYRSQSLAVLRWFLDQVADRSQVMCVIGAEHMADIDDSVSRSPLLPRTLTVPPPDLRRRELLFAAALAAVPQGELDCARLAALSSGFSGADVCSAVLHAAADAARRAGVVDTEAVARAIRETAPSLGSVPMGEATAFGFDKVANLAEVKQRLTEAIVWPMQDPERFTRLGIDPPKGILLHGPPGTGKTFVVKALAHEAGAAFFSVKGAELLDKYVGESERGVRDLFARARAAAPAIIFFDEFDALAPVRGSSTNSVTDSVVAALLTEIDGVGEAGRVSVVAATNRRDLIDPALLRAGRFETHLLLDLPVEESRRALLAITDVPLGDDVDLDDLARRTEGLSFADLTGLLREAALVALRSDDGAMTVHADHVDAALSRVRAGG